VTFVAAVRSHRQLHATKDSTGTCGSSSTGLRLPLRQRRPRPDRDHPRTINQVLRHERRPDP